MNTTYLKFYRPETAEGRRAFTVTELLAIIAIVAVLAALQLPALARATGLSKRAQCAANLRQFALALQIYGGDYGDKLPSSSAGSWCWDLPWNMGDLLTRYGVGWKMMFCPGTSPPFTEAYNYQLYTYTASYRVIGYAMTLPGSTLASSNWNYTLTPQAIANGASYLLPPRPAKRVLLADATISQPGQYSTNPSVEATYNWTSIAGGFSVHHTSSHLTGTIPAGRNAAMLDGHVEWGQLSVMLPRTVNTGTPVFWW
jgi:prepilin-type processing-associated H-X9-DG protein